MEAECKISKAFFSKLTGHSALPHCELNNVKEVLLLHELSSSIEFPMSRRLLVDQISLPWCKMALENKVMLCHPLSQLTDKLQLLDICVLVHVNRCKQLVKYSKLKMG